MSRYRKHRIETTHISVHEIQGDLTRIKQMWDTREEVQRCMFHCSRRRSVFHENLYSWPRSQSDIGLIVHDQTPLTHERAVRVLMTEMPVSRPDPFDPSRRRTYHHKFSGGLR